MEFIDNTGHIFSLNSYDDNYINLDFKEQDYIFWLKDSSVSVNNYYIKPIRFLIDYNIINDSLDVFELEITNNSQFYKLIGAKYLQNKLENISNLSESITLDKNSFTDKLTLKDFYFDKYSFELENNSENLIVYSNNNKFILFPFYVIGRSEIEGTFINNIMIKYKYNTEKIITITKTFTRDEYYDYLMKNTLSNIKIYSCDKNGNNKELVATAFSGYNLDKITSGCNKGLNRYEILYNADTFETVKKTDNVVSSLYDKNDYEHQHNQYKRIRNFISDIYENPDDIIWHIENGNIIIDYVDQEGNLPTDVYHYIYRLDHELPEGYYIFEGFINDGCDYCGSVLGINHDGYAGKSTYGNLYLNSLYENDTDNEYKLRRLYYINPQYTYDENERNWVWEYTNDHSNVPGYTIKEVPVYLHKFRDIWFDIDNKAISENTDGATIEIIEHETQEIYTPISVGCTFIDECEELIINGKNMGIRFPKEILKAVYSSSYYSKYADEKLLKNKLKEILLNYMNIKGECGNVKSMINSLKWFGWNNYVEINRLLKTDNEFKDQFILDYFDIESNIKDTFKYFNQTNNITLSVLDNLETGKSYEQNFNELFIGEGKPVLENLFDKNIEVIKENISYYKPYYNFMFNELALKLDCLKYYYQQYFLPIHINILRASITHKVYANTMKMNVYANTTLIDSPLYLLNNSENIKVEFPDTNIMLFQNGKYLIDSKYNVFSNYNEEYSSEDLYYINENCISIPIKITNNEESEEISEGYFNCKLYLTYIDIEQNDQGHYVYIDNKYVYKENFYKYDMNYFNINNDEENENNSIQNYIDDSYNYILYYNNYIRIDPKNRYNINTIYLVNDNNFNYYQNSEQYYKNFIIIPRILNNNIDWLKGYYRLSLCVNNKWFYYDFTIKVPNIYINLGKLQYKYSIYSKSENETYYPFKQLRSLNPLKFNSFMFNPDLISVNTFFKETDENNNDKLLTFIDKLLQVRDNPEYTMNQFYKEYYKDKIIIPYNKKYFNRIHLFDLYDENNEKIQYHEGQSFEELYSNLFNEDCSFKLDLNENILYDYYLMHDNYVNPYIKEELTQENWQLHLLNFKQEIFNKIINKNGDNNPIIFYNNDYPGYTGSVYRKYTLLSLAFYENNNIKISLRNNDNNEIIEYPNAKYLILEDYIEGYFNYYYFNIFKDENDYNLNNILFTINGWTLGCYNYTPNNIRFEVSLTDNSEDTDFGGVSNLYFNNLINSEALNKKAYWYIVAISQYPIASYIDSSMLDIHTDIYNIGNYTIKYANYSVDKFLINRMDIVNSNGFNHFNVDDLIIAYVDNNDYQFNIDLTNKWSIYKIYDINKIFEINSNSNIVTITNNNKDNLYTPGYYNIQLNYTINGLNNITNNIIGEFKVENNYQEIEYPIIKETI